MIDLFEAVWDVSLIENRINYQQYRLYQCHHQSLYCPSTTRDCWHCTVGPPSPYICPQVGYKLTRHLQWAAAVYVSIIETPGHVTCPCHVQDDTIISGHW